MTPTRTSANEKKARADRKEERRAQLQRFKLDYPALEAENEVLRACKKMGMSADDASLFAADVTRHVKKYHAAVTYGVELRARQNALARNIYKQAKKAIRLRSRQGAPPKGYDEVVDDIVRDLRAIDGLKCASAHRYVSPLMRFEITDHTVRWATHRRPPACQHPGCPHRGAQMQCACKNWPQGSPQDANALAEFEYPRCAKLHELDPRRYPAAAQVGLLRLYEAKCDPRKLSRGRRGPPELVEDQDLIDDLCESFKATTGKSANHDCTRWRSLLSTILEAYGLDYLVLTDNRLKRYESYRAQQMGEYGRISLPRRVRAPDTMAGKPRENSLKSQLYLLRVESEVFMGEPPA